MGGFIFEETKYSKFLTHCSQKRKLNNTQVVLKLGVPNV